jgi:peptide chain release factor 2
MSHLTNRILDLEKRLALAWETLKLEATKAKKIELAQTMSEPGFWDNQDLARQVSQQAADLGKEVEVWENFKQQLTDSQAVLELAETENNEEVKQEVEKTVTSLEKTFANLEFQMLLSGEFDDHSAILSLHAGAGGTDANDWVAMLLRMYTRFAENKGWQVEVLDESRGEETGYKSVTLAIRGRYAYGWLRSEYGVHRLVRISPFDAEKMRHTTFALVEVVPEFEAVDDRHIEIPTDDLRIDTFMSSGKGGQSVNTTYSAVRITHLPTGLSVSCQNERSQLQNKDTALRMLKAKLYHLMIQARAEKISDLKGEHKTAAWGNQIRSYVLHPYRLVKDHRTDIETNDIEAVLNGELELFMEAWLRQAVGRSS